MEHKAHTFYLFLLTDKINTVVTGFQYLGKGGGIPPNYISPPPLPENNPRFK